MRGRPRRLDAEIAEITKQSPEDRFHGTGAERQSDGDSSSGVSKFRLKAARNRLCSIQQLRIRAFLFSIHHRNGVSAIRRHRTEPRTEGGFRIGEVKRTTTGPRVESAVLGSRP